MEILYTTPNSEVKVIIDKQARIIILQTFGEVSLKEHKLGFEKYIDECIAHQFPHMIFNNLEMKTDTPEARVWISTYIIPRFKKAIGDESKVRIAIVENKNLFQKIATKAILMVSKSVGYKFNIDLFDNLDKAIAWIKKP